MRLKTLTIIFVLFSSSISAEIFNCTLTQFNDAVGGEMTYEALVDIGDNKSTVLSLSDIETGKSYDWIIDLFVDFYFSFWEYINYYIDTFR